MMPTPTEPGAPELRIRIPVRGTITPKVVKGKGYAAVQFYEFLRSTITLEIHDPLACQKLREALDEAEAILAAQIEKRVSKGRTDTSSRKRGGS